VRITRATEYAVRCILFLAVNGKGEVVGRKEIAKDMEIPGQFLGKIAQQLAKAGLIEIVQGAKGGYRLLVSPEKISLLNAVEAISGEIFLNDCIMRPASCRRSATCSVHCLWERARTQLRNTLGEVNFAKLMEGESCFGPLEGSSRQGR